ncbi:hypothetical protein G6L13_09790 [Agrobacterium tumefaciens]|uniref:hypothetical protein n=1 Tax=Agrobacterium tumefaciens TaxID=358 RepID=UPI0011477AC8|nr:hypothetical protein [Agrobacterium tumefaciens]NTA80776.1 hypothetical protein [Agrobacterium tumefaciens]
MTEAVKIPPRPRYHDAVVIERAVERLLKPVQEWIDLRAQFQPKDLKSQLTDCIHNNGYEYAKGLEERYGWEPDSGLVERLDWLDIQSAHQNVVRAWVTLYNVKIPFNIGDRVCTPTLRAGTVKDFDRSTAQLAVQSDEDRDNGKDYRSLIDFEDAIPIIGTVGEPAAVEGGAA